MNVIAKMAALVAMILSLVGCAGVPNASPATQIPLAFSPDGMAVANGVIIGANFDGVKESLYTVCLLKRARSLAEQKLILDEPTKFSWKDECEVRETKRYTNNPLMRDIFASTIPTLVSTIVKGEVDKSVLRESARVCRDQGGCPGGGPTIVNQVSSASVAEALSKNDVKIDVSAGTCAAGGTCGR